MRKANFSKLKVKDYVKCIETECVPCGGYEFNGLILAKNVVVTNAIIDGDNGEIGVATVDCIVADCQSLVNNDLDFDFERFGNDLDYRMEFLSNADFDFFYIDRENIIEKISKNDIIIMQENIKIFDSLEDNVVVKLIEDNEVLYLKKDNGSLFVSKDNKYFEKTYYTFLFYISVGTRMVVLWEL